MTQILKNKRRFINYIIEIEWPNFKKKMSKREAECLYCLVLGMTIKQIGRTMKLSPRTVESYILSAKYKLGCYSRHELIKKIFEELI